MTVNLASHKFKLIPEHKITEDERNLWEAFLLCCTERDFDVLYSLYFAQRESQIYEAGFAVGERETIKRLVIMEQEIVRNSDEMRPSATAPKKMGRPKGSTNFKDNDKDQTRFR